MTPAEKLAIAVARARAEGARRELETLERELAALPNLPKEPPRRKKRATPAPALPRDEAAEAAARRDARDLGIPLRRGA